MRGKRPVNGRGRVTSTRKVAGGQAFVGAVPSRVQLIVRMAPTAINVTPTPSFQPTDSPRNAAARTTVSGRLSLSIGLTRDAGPSCNARKYASHETPVATPESTRKTTDRREMPANARCSPVTPTMAHANAVMTTVRIAVARFDGTPSIPIFARIAVSAAATAETHA